MQEDLESSRMLLALLQKFDLTPPWVMTDGCINDMAALGPVGVSHVHT